MIRLGFTGTQQGMTVQQQATIVKILMAATLPLEVHVGDCIGADKEFFDYVRIIFGEQARIIGHIPDNNSKRAFCKYDEERPPKPYLVRNHDIVDESDYLISTPKEHKEQVRSGTWSTIRYARKQKNKKIVIVWPNGIYTGIPTLKKQNVDKIHFL